MAEREQTNYLLRQAHHYVITEGDNDTPATYIDCIQRIDRALLQEIVEQGYDCDPKLYRRVRQKVDHVQREFEDAVDADFSLYDYGELSGCYSALTGESLSRMDVSPATPGFPSARPGTRLNAKNEAEGTYSYGGPTSQPAHWRKSCSSSLPSPEIVCMTDWKSLWTHYDPATGNQDDKDPATSIGVGLKSHRITHQSRLAQYDSGSRFELSTVNRSDVVNNNKMSTVNKLHEAFDVFNQGESFEKINGQYKHASHGLERLHVDHQNRKSLNLRIYQSIPIRL